MSVEIEKICRTCLALNGPLLSIYDGGTYGDTISEMLQNFTKMKPSPTDNMPQKVCLTCISEINRCYSFKMKCENSNRMLRQLLPDARPEELDMATPKKEGNILHTSRSVQTTPECDIVKQAVYVQTSPIVEDWNESLHSEVTPEDIAATPYLDSSAEMVTTAATPARGRKRRNARASTAANAKQPFKKKMNQSYKIDCAEGGYELIVNLDTTPQSDVVGVKQVNDSPAVNPISCTTDNADAYEITDGHYECEEYEVEAVADDSDQTDHDQSDNVVIVKGNSTNNEKSFVIYKSIEDMTPNQRKMSGIKKEYGCTECVMSFYSLKVLRRHMGKLHGLNMDKVELSDVKYRLLDKPETIVTSKTSKNNTEALPIEEEDFKDTSAHSPEETERTSVSKFVCSKCESNFTSQRSLNYHKKKNICNARSYQCDQCDRVFTSTDTLKSHKASHNNASFECVECNKSFMTTEDLSNHQIKIHKRSKRNQCNICKKVFTMLSTLRDHLRTHSGEKPFLCTVCGKAFTQRANLNQHIQRHDKDKKFKCDVCTNSYVTKAELFSHKRSHTGDHPYKCDECSATFTTSSSLVKHKRRHTGERPYACDICPMRFAVLNVLKNHRRLHTGEKPFKCPHCDKRFTQRGDCIIHTSKHIEGNMYVCSCGKTFTHAALLRQHSKRCQPGMFDEQAVHVKISDDENCTVVDYGVTDGEAEGEVEADGEAEAEVEAHIDHEEEEDEEDDEEDMEMNFEKICDQ